MNDSEPPVKPAPPGSFAVEEAAALLAAIVASSNDAILSKTLDGTITSWNLATERLFGYKAQEIIGQSIRKLIPEERQAEEDYILSCISAGQRVEDYETIRLHKDGSLIDVSVTISPVRNQAGTIIGASKIVRDIRERKRAEERIQLLLREVNHRAKNMLSLVQAIASQTISSSPADFLPRFLDRLQALSAHQDLLIQNEWQGIYADEIVLAQLGLFKDVTGQRIETLGPHLLLTPKAAQSIGMAIHELLTNSAKFGALSQESGRVNVVWHQDADEFSMSWKESEGPVVMSPAKLGYGSKIITTVAETMLGGRATIDYASSGVMWDLRCPARNALKPMRGSARVHAA